MDRRDVMHTLCVTAQQGVLPDAQTAAWLRREVKPIAAEQTDLFLTMLCGPYIGTVLMEYGDVVAVLIPELRPMLGFQQNNPHHRYDLWEHSVRAVEAIRPEPVLRLTMLFHDVGKSVCYTEDVKGIGHFYGHAKHSVPLAKRAMARLRLDDRTYDDVLYLVRHHDTPMGQTEQAVRRKLAVHGEQMYRALLAVRKADCVGQGTMHENLYALLESELLFERLLEEEGRWTADRLAVTRGQMSGWGIEREKIEQVQASLLNFVLDDLARNTPEQLREHCCRIEKQDKELVFTVSDMSWKHCMQEVCAVLRGVDAVTEAQVDLPSGRVAVTGNHLSLSVLSQALAEAGYKVAI